MGFFKLLRAHAFAVLGGLGLAFAVVAPGAAADKPDARRIVSIGGDVTEILYELGFAADIVAVDTTSVSPPEALKEKKNVGYMRALSTEGVLSVSPTLILATDKAGPPEVVAALKASSVRYVVIDGADSPEGVDARIKHIGTLLGAGDKAEALIGNVQATFKTLAARRAQIKTPVRVLFLLSLQNGRALAAGANTGADKVIGLAGGVNVAAELSGYQPLSDEAAVGLAPDVILIMDRTQQPSASKIGVAEQVAMFKGLSATPAAKNKKVFEVDGAALLQFGPRTAEATLSLMKLLHPELGGGAGGQ